MAKQVPTTATTAFSAFNRLRPRPRTVGSGGEKGVVQEEAKQTTAWDTCTSSSWNIYAQSLYFYLATLGSAFPPPTEECAAVPITSLFTSNKLFSYYSNFLNIQPQFEFVNMKQYFFFFLLCITCS